MPLEHWQDNELLHQTVFTERSVSGQPAQADGKVTRNGRPHEQGAPCAHALMGGWE